MALLNLRLKYGMGAMFTVLCSDCGKESMRHGKGVFGDIGDCTRVYDRPEAIGYCDHCNSQQGDQKLNSSFNFKSLTGNFNENL